MRLGRPAFPDAERLAHRLESDGFRPDADPAIESLAEVALRLRRLAVDIPGPRHPGVIRRRVLDAPLPPPVAAPARPLRPALAGVLVVALLVATSGTWGPFLGGLASPVTDWLNAPRTPGATTPSGSGKPPGVGPPLGGSQGPTGEPGIGPVGPPGAPGTNGAGPLSSGLPAATPRGSVPPASTPSSVPPTAGPPSGVPPTAPPPTVPPTAVPTPPPPAVTPDPGKTPPGRPPSPGPPSMPPKP